jgi:alkylation response protein AidB-like acyl-CoA dehydrogenase
MTIGRSFPETFRKKLANWGLSVSLSKKEYGGLGFGFLEYAMVMEEFWRVD